jgi:hypothetical protein
MTYLRFEAVALMAVSPGLIIGENRGGENVRQVAPGCWGDYGVGRRLSSASNRRRRRLVRAGRLSGRRQSSRKRQSGCR